MLKAYRAPFLLALSVSLLAGCGGDSTPEDAATPKAASSGCTERDGGWFGRTESGSMIVSQTQAACEDRLND